MKTIIAGSREINDLSLITKAVSECGWIVSEVVSGNARGVDRLGETWALYNAVPIQLFPAEWDVYGKSAGPIRNRKMAEYADTLIAIWDGKSKGTKNMIDTATKLGLTVYVHTQTI